MLSQVYYESQGSTELERMASGPMLVFILLVSVFYLACMWRIFTKAGEPGWYSLIPIWNTYILIRIAGKPGWWLLLLFIPCVSFVVAILVYVGLAERFGKGAGFALGLIFLSPIFFPILAFGSASYRLRRTTASWAGGYPAGGGVSGPVGGFGVPSGGLPPVDIARGASPDPVLPPLEPAVPSFPAIEPEPTAPPPSRPPAQPAPAAPPAPEGWYPDPADPRRIRWWDGSAWTEHTRSPSD